MLGKAEPFGQVVIEGMAGRVPVIAAAAGGPAEVITDDVNGVLYPMGDQSALAAAMRRLADDPRDVSDWWRLRSQAWRPTVRTWWQRAWRTRTARCSREPGAREFAAKP